MADRADASAASVVMHPPLYVMRSPRSAKRRRAELATGFGRRIHNRKMVVIAWDQTGAQVKSAALSLRER